MCLHLSNRPSFCLKDDASSILRREVVPVSFYEVLETSVSCVESECFEGQQHTSVFEKLNSRRVLKLAGHNSGFRPCDVELRAGPFRKRGALQKRGRNGLVDFDVLQAGRQSSLEGGMKGESAA